MTDSFDPLGYLIQQAHAQNIEVHGWIVPFRSCHDLAAGRQYPPRVPR